MRALKELIMGQQAAGGVQQWSDAAAECRRKTPLNQRHEDNCHTTLSYALAGWLAG
jgi:hypothetical protein